MFVCKEDTILLSLRTFHVYLAYRRPTGNVVTRQTFDPRAPHNKPHTAHISRGNRDRYICFYNFAG